LKWFACAWAVSNGRCKKAEGVLPVARERARRLGLVRHYCKLQGESDYCRNMDLEKGGKVEARQSGRADKTYLVLS
jgi:hypothetical protein